MSKSGIYFIFTVAMITENGCQNGLNIEKLPFRTTFVVLGDRIFLIISNSKQNF